MIPNNHIKLDGNFTAEDCRKGFYLILQHAYRIPPHIGVLINNAYHSLSVKGPETNVNGDALFKNIQIRKIPTIISAIDKHPVFSNDFLGESFAEIVLKHNRVDESGTTCLLPVKDFFCEFYAIPRNSVDLIKDLYSELYKNNFISGSVGLFLDEGTEDHLFALPMYNRKTLNEKIRETFHSITK